MAKRENFLHQLADSSFSFRTSFKHLFHTQAYKISYLLENMHYTYKVHDEINYNIQVQFYKYMVH